MSRCKRYHYPRELLDQPYFQIPGGPVLLSATTLGHEGFISPLDSLLTKLEADGYDISAAKAEAAALRAAVKTVMAFFGVLETEILKVKYQYPNQTERH